MQNYYNIKRAKVDGNFGSADLYDRNLCIILRGINLSAASDPDVRLDKRL